MASADPLHLAAAVALAENGGYQDLHIDIEDGNFIPNITFGVKTVRALRSISRLPFSFHLMTTRPADYLPDIAGMSPSCIFAHIEALDYPAEFLMRVRTIGCRTGLAINPKTAVDSLTYLLDRCDGIMVMTAEPDGRGQEFLPRMLEKVRFLRSAHPSLEIWADGGIRREMLPGLEKAGVEVAVMGRAVFGEKR